MLAERRPVIKASIVLRQTLRKPSGSVEVLNHVLDAAPAIDLSSDDCQEHDMALHLPPDLPPSLDGVLVQLSYVLMVDLVNSTSVLGLPVRVIFDVTLSLSLHHVCSHKDGRSSR